ncbi:MAG: hypothetical protein EXR78_00545 [Deltaproteobacteria bacterium]|nr:hypothetical protein [Deltaproteobacteria bacterium]
MASPATLIEQSRKRLVRQQRINICGLYLPPLGAALVLGNALAREFSFSLALVGLSVFTLLLRMGLAFRRARRTVESIAVAASIDEKTNCQERLLTLATMPATETTSPFVALLQRQTEEKTTTFSPQRAFPFALDRRVFLTVIASALSLLVLFLPPLESAIVPPPSPAPSTTNTVQRELEILTDVARSLMRDGKTPQEKTAGAQLLALAEQLKDPTIPPKEKQQLIEETKQRLELPLPQILPFQLDLFASKGDKGKGDQGNQSQQGGKQQDKNNNKNTDPSQTPLQSAAGNAQQQEQKDQPGSQQGGKKSEQQKPQESGGGIKFDQSKPEQQGEKREQAGQDSSGEQQKADQNQSPDGRTQGKDPNQPGGQDGSGQDPQKQGPNPQRDPQQPGQEQKGAGGATAGGPGERFLKEGEQPGGFLTKDARFVKVRIPFSHAPQKEGENLTENTDRAQPNTPYSNAPLKEAPPDQVQAKQPVPLEYRTILK